MAAAAHSHEQRVRAREVHGAHDVRGAQATGDQRGTAIEHAVEDLARVLVAGGIPQQQLPPQPGAEVLHVGRGQQDLLAVAGDCRHVGGDGRDGCERTPEWKCRGADRSRGGSTESSSLHGPLPRRRYSARVVRWRARGFICVPPFGVFSYQGVRHMINRRRFVQSSLAAAVAYALPAPRLYALDQAASQAAGGLAAVKLDGSATVIEQAAVAELKGSLRGPLLLSGDAGYDSARRILHPQFDKRPALIVQPTGAADVRSAVTFARERELLVAVKCGGHSFSGKSTCDGGIQIDLSRLRGVRIDPTARRAYVEGGSLLGELDHEAMAHGLVTTAGTVSHTGVGGLTLGGGFGRVARRFGLALDNVKSVDIVTADGQLRHASAEENPDLFWAVRGGGGNFGIVTGFEFGLHPMQRQIIGGDLVFPIERARELLEFYGEYSDQRAGRDVCRLRHEFPDRAARPAR